MALTVEPNDPTELLEVLDARGASTGRAKPRASVHRDGDWHRVFHCWITRPGRRGLEVVLQQRSLRKDTFPGFWDASAAGHWRFGEAAEEAAREIAEELGLAVPFDRLVPRRRERVARRHPNGLLDREHQEVFTLHWPAPLSSYQPDPGQVAALAAVPAAELVALAAGERLTLPATEAVAVGADGSVQAVEVEVFRSQVVPYPAARLRRLLVGSQ